MVRLITNLELIFESGVSIDGYPDLDHRNFNASFTI